MLSWIEKILFALAALASIVSALYTARRIVRIIRRGHGRPDWFTARKRLFGVLGRTISLQPTFRLRLGPSLLHAMVAWGFIDYLLVNLGEVLHAYLPGFLFLGTGWIGNIFRLGADVLSVGVLMSMVALLLRRFLLKPEHLNTRPEVLLYPRARSGIRRDSLVVGAFILLHVGSHFLGASIKIASTGEADAWQPLASALARLWTNWRPPAYEIAIHVAFWLAMGTILAFIPYFLYSKHIHLFFAPLNFLLKPERRSMGELGAIDFEDESQEQFGATRLEDLGWEQLMDA